MLHLMVFPNVKTLNPSLQCHNLTVSLHSSHSFLALIASFLSLKVPLPAFLLDCDALVTSRPLSDHIEVKLLLLLLPVDHPVLSTVDDSRLRYWTRWLHNLIKPESLGRRRGS
ncbi:hypothetical protein Fmac_021812 [Flemingia macrophylla]|uniref:Uncharacterized protein n=1 Tax=Flemingia macrophylla TaxID=520843 RepID=A0ABD1LZQ5_9FABA